MSDGVYNRIVYTDEDGNLPPSRPVLAVSTASNVQNSSTLATDAQVDTAVSIDTGLTINLYKVGDLVHAKFPRTDTFTGANASPNGIFTGVLTTEFRPAQQTYQPFYASLNGAIVLCRLLIDTNGVMQLVAPANWTGTCRFEQNVCNWVSA